jgi:hypothetical protein
MYSNLCSLSTYKTYYNNPYKLMHIDVYINMGSTYKKKLGMTKQNDVEVELARQLGLCIIDVLSS